MLKVFDVVPGWVYAVMVAFLVVSLGVAYLRMAHAEQEFALYRAEVAENTRKAEAEARAKEQAMQQQVERVSRDAQKRQNELSNRVAAAGVAAGSLRDEINRLNARPAPQDSQLAACFGEARVARELLGACTVEYRGVAQAADELRDQVIGLQDFVKSVVRQQEEK